MISLFQMKTADTAHTGIFASLTRPFPIFGRGLGTRLTLYCAVQSRCSILSHDTLHHCLSSNSSLENSKRGLT